MRTWDTRPKTENPSHFLGQETKQIIGTLQNFWAWGTVTSEIWLLETCIYYQDYMPSALACREMTPQRGMKAQMHERYIPASSAVGQEHMRRSADTRLHVSGMQPGPHGLGHALLGAHSSLEERISALHQSWPDRSSGPVVAPSWSLLAHLNPRITNHHYLNT